MASGNTLAFFAPVPYDPPVANPAGFGTRDATSPHPVLTFDTTTQEIAVFSGLMPQHYGGGNLKVIVHWAAATATTGTIGWDVTFERIAKEAQDTDEEGWATAQTITAATVPAAAGVVQETNVSATAGAAGTDSVAAGDLFRLRVRRDVANDTATGDAHFLGVEIREA